jgi:hypothetical protein
MYRGTTRGGAGVQMTNRVLLAGLFAALAFGCSSSERGAPAPAKETDAATQGPAIDYGSDFQPLERGLDGSTWRWMGATATIRLKNTHRDMILTVKGRAPLTVPHPPTIQFEFNGEPLDPIPEARGEVQSTFQISAAKQADKDWSMLRITTNETFVPHEVDPKAEDRRRLGVALYELSWEAK